MGAAAELLVYQRHAETGKLSRPGHFWQKASAPPSHQHRPS